jgi:putative salt-induced outer membrane protein YdiY
MAVFLAINCSSIAQIVNIEKERGNENSEGLSGVIGFSFSFTKNTSSVLQAASTVNIGYKKNKNAIIFMGDVGMVQANGQNFLNDGFVHLRFNHNITENFLTAEVFTQIQYNQLWLLNSRILFGGGPRMTLVKNDTIQLLFGPMLMAEQEQVVNHEKTNTIRLSSYLSFGWNIKEKVILSTITYVQPNLRNFTDYRLSHESAVKIIIFKHLSFKVIYESVYDSKPPATIPKLNYSLVNALSLSF